MKPFAYSLADTPDNAVQQATAAPGARFIAGGTTLLDLMKYHIETPSLLVDINPLDCRGIHLTKGELRIGSLETMSGAAAHPAVRKHFPALAESLLLAASPQLRNMATLGGNLMQRTRCGYFRDPAFPCNKREPGSGCAALAGIHRTHAVLGTSPQCIATHASDFAVALSALDGVVHLTGPGGERAVPAAAFHLVPGDTPQRETVLQHGELITGISVPVTPPARRSHYLKLRDRTSYAFALVSVAAGLEVRGGVIREARLALGGVATKPWRVPAAEQALRGRKPTEEAFRAAAAAALADAQPQPGNGFKVPLAQNAIVHALTTLSQA